MTIAVLQLSFGSFGFKELRFAKETCLVTKKQQSKRSVSNYNNKRCVQHLRSLFTAHENVPKV